MVAVDKGHRKQDHIRSVEAQQGYNDGDQRRNHLDYEQGQYQLRYSRHVDILRAQGDQNLVEEPRTMELVQ